MHRPASGWSLVLHRPIVEFFPLPTRPSPVRPSMSSLHFPSSSVAPFPLSLSSPVLCGLLISGPLFRSYSSPLCSVNCLFFFGTNKGEVALPSSVLRQVQASVLVPATSVRLSCHDAAVADLPESLSGWRPCAGRRSRTCRCCEKAVC